MSFVRALRAAGMPVFSGMFLLIAVAPVAALPERVPGTRVSLEVPRGFAASPDYAGFQKPEQAASIVVTEAPVPFAQFRENFTREAFEKRGLNVVESGKRQIEGRDGILSQVVDSSGETVVEAWILAFGDFRQSVLIVASYPKMHATELSSDMRRCLLSALWDQTIQVGLFEGLPFKIDEPRKLKIAGRQGDAVILTKDGRSGRESPEDPFVVVGSSRGQMEFGNLESYSIDQLKQIGLVKDVANIRGTLKSVDDMPGYELTADAVDAKDGTPLLVYQLIAGEGQQTYWVIGFVGASGAMEYLGDMQAVGSSLRRNE